MRINKKYEFVFVSTPKAGTHTIYRILKEHYSERLLEAGFHNNRIVNGYHHYFRWTVVRNPFSRAVSIWWSACRLAHKDQYGFQKGCGTKDDFDQFIRWFVNESENHRQREPLMQNQSTWLAPVQPIHIIRLEYLKEELSQLPFWKDEIEIPQLNTTDEKIIAQSEFEGKAIERPSMEELYKNPETIELVLEWAREDFEKFGYHKCLKK